MESVNRSYLAALMAIIFWGTTFALSKSVVSDPLSPLVFIAFRSIVGFLFIFTYLGLTGQIGAWFQEFRQHYRYLFFLGAGLYSASYLVQYWGMIHTTTINQAIIANIQTFFVVFYNAILFKKKAPRRFILGAVIAFFGVFIIIFRDGIVISGSTLGGDIISIFAFAFWGLYTACSKPINIKANPLFNATSILLTASVLLVPLTAMGGGFSQLNSMNTQQWGIIMYLAIFCTSITFILWNWALSNPELGTEKIAIFSLLNPVVGILTSMLFLGEILTWKIALGSIIIFAALIFANSSPKREKLNSSTD